MAEPPRNIPVLSRTSHSHAVFEADQVLTFDQLNGVVDYLEDQARLTRVHLLGVGLIGGLRAARRADGVFITRGIGATTDGDLLALPVDALYRGYKPYGASAPRYAPFYVGETMRTVHELVVDPGGDPLAKPLSAFPGKLSEMVVALLMERYEDDPDLCTGVDCDNLGKTAVETLRVLLLSRADAAALHGTFPTAREASIRLDWIAADRPSFSSSTSTPTALVATFRDACKGTHARLSAALTKLNATLPGLVSGVFGQLPAWSILLDKHATEFASRSAGIQYYYDFLKDAVDGWNELLEVLACDGATLLPDVGAFPKHLLLGDLTDPTSFRTGCHPSPLVDGGAENRQRARSLLRRLHAMIVSFSVPSAPLLQTVVTPSRSEAAALHERAIPYYYAVTAETPIHRDWSFERARRRAQADTPGFRAKEYGGSAAAVNPLAFRIGRDDFFRVEGHLGRDVKEVKAQLDALVASRNLPFAVRAVLLHDDRRRLVVKPDGRYGDLHRLHYLIRNDVLARLSEAGGFNEGLKSKIDAALARDVPDPGQKLAATARTRHAEVKSSVAAAVPALKAKRYADYAAEPNWNAAYKTVVNSTAGFKSEFGEVARTDVSTPFDAVAVDSKPVWLGWLDLLIQRKDQKEDDRLLFTNFIAAHPGFDHFAGAPRGGTFVLLYDDAGRVVADGALAHHWPETAEPQADEPDLPPPDYKIPQLVDEQIKIKPPIDVAFDRFKVSLEPVWNEKLNVQRDYFKFFRESVDTLGKVLVPRTAALRADADVKDAVLGLALDQSRAKADQIRDLREILLRPDLSAEQRALATKQFKTLQTDLANQIVDTTQYVAATKADLASGADGGAALSGLAELGGLVAEPAAREQMIGGLKRLQASTAVAPQKEAIKSLLQNFGS